MPWDFSKPETMDVYQQEVERRITEYGMTREEAEMLVSILMATIPEPEDAH